MVLPGKELQTRRQIHYPKSGVSDHSGMTRTYDLPKRAEVRNPLIPHHADNRAAPSLSHCFAWGALTYLEEAWSRPIDASDLFDGLRSGG